MGWGIKLTEEQWNELDRVRFTAKSADVFRNCLIILKSDSRDTIASIAEDLGCSPDTVTRVRRLYRKGGVETLKPISSSIAFCNARRAPSRAICSKLEKTTGSVASRNEKVDDDIWRILPGLVGQTGS